ncbi:hypothetical protein [Actinoplanes sp. NPDC051411]|uniref:hypothetical protein n=1 Tax=Actinoplanes sp. NPDC051411 TaxID=3155522 RepID=UPI003424177D
MLQEFGEASVFVIVSEIQSRDHLLGQFGETPRSPGGSDSLTGCQPNDATRKVQSGGRTPPVRRQTVPPESKRDTLIPRMSIQRSSNDVDARSRVLVEVRAATCAFLFGRDECAPQLLVVGLFSPVSSSSSDMRVRSTASATYFSSARRSTPKAAVTSGEREMPHGHAQSFKALGCPQTCTTDVFE